MQILIQKYSHLSCIFPCYGDKNVWRINKFAGQIVAVLCLLFSSACTFNVTSTADREDADPGDGTCADSYGECTLRAAVTEAHESFGAYRIMIPAGRYGLNIPRALELRQSISLQGAGKGETIVDGLGNSGVIVVTARRGTARIQSLTLTGGDAGAGGGMYVKDGTVILTDMQFDDNYGEIGGGGLYIEESAHVEGDYIEFTNNEADELGGAVANFGRLILRNSLLTANSATHTGALFNGDVLDLINVTVSGNRGNSNRYGVGGIDQFGTAVLRNVTITENEGGGSYGVGGLKTRQTYITVLKNS